MTGVLIKVWDLSVSNREISLLIPLETSIKEAVQELVGWGALSSLVDRASVEHTREVVEDILAGRYNYTWDTHLGLRMRGSDWADSPDSLLLTEIKTETGEDPLDLDKLPPVQDDVFVKEEMKNGEKKTKKKLLFNCEVCGKDFKVRQMLLRHMTIHTGEKPHVCEVCDTKFTQKGSLTKHIRLFHSGMNTFPCHINCSEQFESRQLLKQHQKENHQKQFCTFCSKAFLDEHTCSKSEIFICDINCSEVFESKQLLQEHQHENHPECYCSICAKAFLGDHACALHKCEVCGKDFKEKKLLRRHMLIHSGEKSHICDICDRKFALKGLLTRHVKLAHSGMKSFLCDINCSEEFESKRLLKEHQRESHQEDYCSRCSKAFLDDHSCPKPTILRCDINCSEEFESKQLLKHHQQMYHPEYYCDRCSKAFLTDHNCDLHKCEVCGKDYKGKAILKTHMLTHTGEKQHVCDICGTKFTQKGSLTKHVRLFHSGVRLFPCEINCSEQFESRQLLKQHQKESHQDYFCSVCSKAFLNEHTCPKPEVFRCDINCSQEFESKQLLKEHQQENHPQYYCSFCTKAFLTDHICDLHKCDVCGKDFKGKKLLKRHMMIHTGERQHICDACGKKFFLKCLLTRHVKLAHSDNYTCKLYKCEVCGKDLKGKRVLKLHMLIHTGEKPHICDTCGKKFTQKTTLDKHVKFVHSDIKHPCDQCDAEFKDEKYLENHKKFVHAGVEENVCDICSSSFVLRKQLKIHIRMVHEEKSFFCPVCEKGFAFLNGLKSHMLIHGEKKTEVCDMCSMAFYSRHRLQKHKKCVHGEKKFICDVCKIGFTTNYYLTRHRQTHKDPLYKTLVDDC